MCVHIVRNKDYYYYYYKDCIIQQLLHLILLFMDLPLEGNL